MMNWLDIVVIILLGSGLVRGLVEGLIKQFIGLISLVLAFIFSGTLAGLIRIIIESYVHWETSFPPGTVTAIYYIIAFIIIISVFGLVAHLIDKVIKYTPVGAFNRLGGAAFGLIISLLILSLALNILAVFDAESKIIHTETQEKSIFYTPVRMALPAVYPYIKEFF